MSDQAWLASIAPASAPIARSFGAGLIRARGASEPKAIHFDDLPGLLANLRGQ